MNSPQVLLRSLVYSTLLLATATSGNAAPYGPEGLETVWNQADGAKLVLRVFGDEFYARTETLDGYTVVHVPAERSYFYAEHGPGGDSVVAGAIKAHLAAPAGLPKHLSEGTTRIREARLAKIKKFAGEREERWRKRVQAVRKQRDIQAGLLPAPAPGAPQSAASAQQEILAAPVNGAKIGLTILVQFPDDPNTGGSDPTNFPTTQTKMERYCNQVGYPDLYDYGGDSEGVGNHCLMGAGNHNNGGKTPAPLNAYFKDIVGWANVTDYTPTQVSNVSIPTTGNIAYRIRKPGLSTEYFIVENHGSGDKWANYLPDKGIAIWHVDEAKNGNNEQQMTASEHYEVSLEQADGLFDLENDADRGDGQDLFCSGDGLFTDLTTPDAHWWDAAASGIQIEVTFAPGAVGSRSAAIHIASNDADENPFDIALTGYGRTAVESWRFAHYGIITNTGNAANMVDSDGDTFLNLMEYAFKMDPTQADDYPVTRAMTAGSVSVTYPRNGEGDEAGWGFAG